MVHRRSDGVMHSGFYPHHHWSIDLFSCPEPVLVGTAFSRHSVRRPPHLFHFLSFIRNDQQFAAPLHVVTHNMNALKYYVKRADFDSNQQSFQAWIAKNDFDIICLQEMIEVQREPFLIPGYNKASLSKKYKVRRQPGPVHILQVSGCARRKNRICLQLLQPADVGRPGYWEGHHPGHQCAPDVV